MKITKSLFTTLLLVTSLGSIACINEYRTQLTGKVVYGSPVSGRVSVQEIDTLELKDRANVLLLAYHRSDSIEYFSDYAAALIYLGEYQKAKQIYHQIESETPDLYTTASNLGTIYELIGQPDSALFWIKKSMVLNNQSHGGSEWIHVKILEFKLAQSKDYQQSILGLNFGSDSIPSNPENYNLEEMYTHLWHQLKERTNFVKPKNEIVGNIYFDLGNVGAQHRDMEIALESYAAAKEYGFESELMDARIAVMERLKFKEVPNDQMEGVKALIRGNMENLLWVALFLIILFLTISVKLTLKFIRKRKKRSA